MIYVHTFCSPKDGDWRLETGHWSPNTQHPTLICGIQVPDTGLLSTLVISRVTRSTDRVCLGYLQPVLNSRRRMVKLNRQPRKIGTNGNDNIYTCREWGRSQIEMLVPNPLRKVTSQHIQETFDWTRQSWTHPHFWNIPRVDYQSTWRISLRYVIYWSGTLEINRRLQ